MGYIFALPDFLNPNPITEASQYLKSSENAAFPATNVGIINRAHVPWISSGNLTSGTTYVGMDLGAQKSVAAVIIDNINISSIKIQSAGDAGFSSALKSETVTVSPYLVERNLLKDATGQSMGRYKCCFLTAGTTLTPAEQYWRVLANTGTAIDGSTGAGGAKMSVGSIVFAGSVVTIPGAISSWGELPLEATRPNDNFDGGGSEPVILGNPYSALILGSGKAPRSTMRADLLKVLRAGIGRWMVVYKNAGDTSEFIICRRTADVTLTIDSPNTFSFQNFALEGAC